jgi:HEPN domain-containing protein
LPRKTDSNNPADWVYLSELDLAGIRELSAREVGYEMCRGKLAEVIEKLIKAELIGLGWNLEKTHDLRRLFGELEARHSSSVPMLRPLVTGYAEIYFMARYPGFDLEDPDWSALRQDVAAAEGLLVQLKTRLQLSTSSGPQSSLHRGSPPVGTG